MPTGVAISINQILIISRNIGGFLIILGGILAGLTIIISGITYFFAGSNPQMVGTAKSMLKAGIIGALIIFSVGTMISVIRGFANNPFQFFGSGPLGGTCDTTLGECFGGSNAGNSCTSNANC